MIDDQSAPAVLHYGLLDVRVTLMLRDAPEDGGTKNR